MSVSERLTYAKSSQSRSDQRPFSNDQRSLSDFVQLLPVASIPLVLVVTAVGVELIIAVGLVVVGSVPAECMLLAGRRIVVLTLFVDSIDELTLRVIGYLVAVVVSLHAHVVNLVEVVRHILAVDSCLMDLVHIDFVLAIEVFLKLLVLNAGLGVAGEVSLDFMVENDLIGCLVIIGSTSIFVDDLSIGRIHVRFGLLNVVLKLLLCVRVILVGHVHVIILFGLQVVQNSADVILGVGNRVLADNEAGDNDRGICGFHGLFRIGLVCFG